MSIPGLALFVPNSMAAQMILFSSVGPSDAIDETVEGEIKAGHIPGAVVLVGERGETVCRAAYGLKTIEPSPSPLVADDIFDLASLTKVVATTIAVMQLVEQERLCLDGPAAKYWPAFGVHGKEKITVQQLLTHTSGLPPGLDLGGGWRGNAQGLHLVTDVQTSHPPGSSFTYSDINFIILGELIHQITGERLDAYVRRHIFRPLKMVDTGFLPPVSMHSRLVPTERVNGELRWGQVHDPTAYRMGGVAGHAGLFSTADDLARFARMLLGGGILDNVRILKADTVTQMTRPASLPGGVRRGLGWDMSSRYSGGMDTAFGPLSYGHTGFTGCSLWIDPSAETFLIILTSRLHPNGLGDVKPLRRKLAELVASWASPQPVSSPVALPT